MHPGLYCKIGYKYYPDNHAEDDNIDENLGVFEPITEDVLLETETTDDLGNYCKNFIRIGKSIITGENDTVEPTCDERYWSPLSYFINEDNLNLGPVVPINEMCKRCDNGYMYNVEEETCAPCPGISENSHGKIRNQYKQNDSGYSLGDGPDFGKGLEKYCNMDPAVVTTLEQTCGQLHSVGMGCPDNMAWQLDDTRAATAVTYRAKCCEACKPGEKLDTATHNCVPCPVGYQQDRGNVEKCEKCVDDTYSSAQTNGECIPCPEGERPNKDKNACGNYCTKELIIDGHCQETSADPIPKNCTMPMGTDLATSS